MSAEIFRKKHAHVIGHRRVGRVGQGGEDGGAARWRGQRVEDGESAGAMGGIGLEEW